MKISELQPKQGKIEVEGIISEKGEVREFQKFGKAGKVCNAVLKDDTGEVKLTLWNEQAEEVNEGDKVKITNGYVGEWQGEKQLSTGKFGKLEVIEKGTKKEETAEEPEEDSEDEEVEDLDVNEEEVK